MPNGQLPFIEGDTRLKISRRFRDVLASIVTDLGGVERLSEGQRQMARRCAMLSVECEKMESAAVAGSEPHRFKISPLQQMRGLKVADRIGLEFAFSGGFAFNLRQPGDPVALQTPVKGRARQMRDRGLQDRTVDLGCLGPVGRSETEDRAFHLATVFGLTP